MTANDHQGGTESAPQTLESSSRETFIVGIGASAGGLEALERFFRPIPLDSGFAFVVVQHLSPNFKSLMDELLARQTPLPIQVATDGVGVEPDHIYLTPHDHDMTIDGRCIHLHERKAKEELSMPIDRFFHSLAEDVREHAIAVVLSGTGTDGSRGIRSVHEEGGFVVVQDERSAKFDGMPRSAVDTNLVDFICPPEEMIDILLRYRMSPLSRSFTQDETDHPEPLTKLHRLLEDRFGIDFSTYKPTTIDRRIERRLLMHENLTLEEYVDHLRDDLPELNRLYHDLLIGVTRFFRDAEAWKSLETEVLGLLGRRTDPGNEFRIWTVATATGEEAYSLSILMNELRDNLSQDIPFKIFATDVHQESIDIASAGTYPTESLRNVSDERRNRFFSMKPAGWRLFSEVRRPIVFAKHNCITDTPFTNLDLVTCRNLLIYLKPETQLEVLQQLTFGLRVGGLLWLGPSETLGALEADFELIDRRWKIYRKLRRSQLPRRTRGAMRPPASSEATEPMVTETASISSGQFLQIYDRLLEDFMPPSILVTEQKQIAHCFGDSGRFLRPVQGRFSTNVSDLLWPDLRVPASITLQRALSESVSVCINGVEAKVGENQELLSITANQVQVPGNNGVFLLLQIEQDESATHSSSSDTQRISRYDSDESWLIRQELESTRETLQFSIQELQAANEEMQATNEELIASNEELQATNEELHSVNEELYTVNAEHQRKIVELTELTDDMENLLNSTHVDIIFLDRDLCIRKFTPGFRKLFNLIPQDIGRKIDNLTNNLRDHKLIDYLKDALRTGTPRTEEVQDTSNRWHLMRIRAYLSDSEIEGIVMSFVDITDMKEAETRLAELSEIVQQSDDAIFRVDRDGIVRTWNPGAVQLYSIEVEEAVGMSITRLMSDQDPRTIEIFQERVRSGTKFKNFDMLHRDDLGHPLHVSLTVSPLVGRNGEIVGASVIARDVTRLRRAELEARQAVKRRDTFLALLSHELRNPLGAIVNASHTINNAEHNSDLDRQARGVIERQCRQMSRLMEDLLDVSRITQNKIRLRKELFDLRDIVPTSIQVVQPEIDRKAHRVEYSVPQDQALYIRADRSRIEQVLVNLVSNAVKYTPPGGQIEVNLDWDDREAVLEVSDDGIGIPQDHLETIFEMFEQTDTAVHQAETGMGLGLTLVRSLVGLHDGDVTADSDGPDEGSRFTVRLPLVDEQIEEVRKESRPKQRDTIHKVALIEDVEDARTMLTSLLQLWGFEVKSAAEGATGIELINEFRPDIALIDIGLPGLSGYDIAEELRGNKELSNTLLVALTGYGQDSDRQRARQAGFDSHLVKPVDIDALQVLLGVEPQ